MRIKQRRRWMAEEVDTPFLGTLALRSVYRDNSKPTVLLDQEVSREYAHLVKGLEKSLRTVGGELAVPLARAALTNLPTLRD